MPAENIHHTPQPPDQGHEADIPPATPELIVHESTIPEVDDPRYHAVTQIVKKTFPELEGMDAGEVAKTLYPVLWDIVDPENTVSKAKKDAIEDWSAGVFPQVLEQGSLREASDVADVLAQGNPHLHEERRSVKDEARTDAMTGLGNAKSFKELMDSLDKNPDRLLTKAFCYFDVNGLKSTNDSFSNVVGDYLIKVASAHIRRGSDQLFSVEERSKGEGPQIFRISEGADDFIVVLPREMASEFAEYVSGSFGLLDGEELDYQNLNENGEPTQLVPPEKITLSSAGREHDHKAIGYLGFKRDSAIVKSSLAVGIATPIDLYPVEDENMTLEQRIQTIHQNPPKSEKIIEIAFKNMKQNKDWIAENMPDLAKR